MALFLEVALVSGRETSGGLFSPGHGRGRQMSFQRPLGEGREGRRVEGGGI